MNIREVIEKYSSGKGESAMWSSVGVISDMVDKYLPENVRSEMVKEIYHSMVGGHYNKFFADEQIKKMFYIDMESGERHYAPYWDEEDISRVFMSIRNEIPSEYNVYDFEVAVSRMKSDYYNLLREWFPEYSKEDILERIVQLTVNYFNDDDCSSREKVWNDNN